MTNVASERVFRVRRPRTPDPLPSGFDATVNGLAGRWRRAPWRVSALLRRAERIHAAAQTFRDLPDEALRERMAAWRYALRRDPDRGGGCIDDALAGVAEAARRSLGLAPYPVQLAGGLAMHHGHLAEMATGEGKTLTACLPAVLAAWSGRPCHLVTANDYLAARDAEIMAPVYAWCGVSVASITDEDPQEVRPARYAADVVYITAKELLGDVLRDRLATGGGPDPTRLLLDRWLGGEGAQPGAQLLLVRGIDTAIVDEADSILIDEAVTPLILSSRQDSRGIAEAAMVAAEVAASLIRDTDYRIAERQKAVTLRPGAVNRMAEAADRLPSLWRAAPRREELLRQALTARHFLKRDQHYVVQDGKVVLLDEFTGRMTPNRTLSAGLHQAIEAREGLEVTAPTEPLAQMSFQSFFRHFRRLSGMSGTASEAGDEFWHVYGLAVLPIPTNRKPRRIIAAPRVFAEETAKWNAVVEEIERVHATGRPILVGTRSVDSSERLASRLRERGLVFELLNAVHHKEEGRIIAQAGGVGRITIATNMAGRGTDIKLGPRVEELGGLHVVVVELNLSRRIDRQLFGRCARQGDPGSVCSFLSLDDEVVVRFGGPLARRLLATASARGLSGLDRLARFVFRMGQERAEHLAYTHRQSVLQNDGWLDTALPSARVR